MNSALIFTPVLAQVFLTLLLYALLSVRKKQAAKSGQVNQERRSLHNDAWPDSVLKVNNCIRNQFEIPVLFYIVCFVLFSLQAAGTLATSVACLFVITRTVHAFIHTGSNHVPTRRKVFTLGCVLVLILWAIAVKALI